MGEAQTTGSEEVRGCRQEASNSFKGVPQNGL